MVDAAARLYELPLDAFVRERDALARELRKGGDREAADEVKALPKPTPVAWTINRLSREDPDLVRELLDAGETLRAAQEAALGGGGAAELRDAAAAEREAVDALVDAAAGARPSGRKLSGALMDRLRATLHAAAADDAVRDAIAAGRLEREAEGGGAWGFMGFSGGDAPAPARRQAAPKPKPKPRAATPGAAKSEPDAAEAKRRAAEERERKAEERNRNRAEEREQRQAAMRRRTVERELEEARAELASAEERVARARDRVARLEEQLD